MRLIIACAGSQTKWAGHLGVPSHLAPLTAHGGVPLLYRTIGQARELTADVHVTAPAGDRRYRVPGTTLHEQDGSAPSEYAATRALWATDVRTVLLLGDVYFSDAAMARIATSPGRRYRVFGRFGPSHQTGTPYGEIFAASWWPEQHAQMDAHLDLVHRTRAAGTITRPPGWMLLRAWQGTPLAKHRVDSRYFEEIDDLTDDIDFPADYERHPATRRH
ncbi:hypothetical protein [Streptomyces sp. NPDC090026]|uniref:hypothetical protein n=1 Tax=Streptomyces sp. NPDC090026 TaxID=3365923 RepID=UPI0037F6A051